MPALNPNIINDTKALIHAYKGGGSFKIAFDKIVKNDIRATYKGRPVKLYVEVLANINIGYKQDYEQVKRISLHDNEGRVGELFEKVKLSDFFLLDAAELAAKQGLNSTSYSEQDIEQINKIENNATDRKEKRETYAKREESLKPTKEAPEEEEQPIPSHQTEKPPESPKPAEPTPAPVSLPGVSETRSWTARIGNLFRRGAINTTEKVGVTAITEGVTGGIARTFSTRVGARFAAGRVVTAGVGKLATKLGVGTAIKAGVSLAVKAGASLAAGIATGGISTAIQAGIMLVTNPKAIKDLLRYILWIVIAVFILLFMGSSTNRGIKMNSLLPPYPIGGNAGISPTPPGDLDKRCNFSAFDIFNAGAVDDNLLKKYMDRALGTGKIRSVEQRNNLLSRAKYIRDQAQSVGLNPAIFLGYWESETGFSDYTNPNVRPGADLGCDPTNGALKTFEESVLCAIGKSSISNVRTAQCAVSKDINSSFCQAIAFQQAQGVKLPISTLKDFLDSYGSKVADPNNATSDNIVKQTIVDLGLVSCTNIIPSVSPPQNEFALTCPIANENNTCSDRYDPIDPCHCNPDLGFVSNTSCSSYPAINYGIDVGTKASKTALIPYIVYQGENTPQNISCQLIAEESPTCPEPNSGCQWQQTLHYKCPTKNNTIYLLYSHILSNPQRHPQTISSGQAVGDVANYGSGLRRLNIQLGVDGDCTGSNIGACKRGGAYFQCPLQKESLDY